MHDPLIGVVVSVREQRHPSLRQTVCVHSIAVILGGDQTAATLHMTTWLIVAAVTVSKMGKSLFRRKKQRKEKESEDTHFKYGSEIFCKLASICRSSLQQLSQEADFRDKCQKSVCRLMP